MQRSDDKSNEGGKNDREVANEKEMGLTKNDEVADEGEVADEEATSTSDTYVVTTKTEDGGRNEQVNPQSLNHGQEETTESNRPDFFQIYSDNDTRMLTLLGVDPTANPNDGEQQEDWRQLTGFLGGGEGQRRNNDDNDGDATPPRRTRLATELHATAFQTMWVQQGLLPENGALQGQRPRQQEEERGGDNDNTNQQD